MADPRDIIINAWDRGSLSGQEGWALLKACRAGSSEGSAVVEPAASPAPLFCNCGQPIHPEWDGVCWRCRAARAEGEEKAEGFCTDVNSSEHTMARVVRDEPSGVVSRIEFECSGGARCAILGEGTGLDVERVG